jgi:hypothetical protein
MRAINTSGLRRGRARVSHGQGSYASLAPEHRSVHNGRPEVPLPPPQRHVHQRDHHRHFDERPDLRGERLPGADVEDTSGDGDGQLMPGVNIFLQWKTTFRIEAGLDQTCILALLMLEQCTCPLFQIVLKYLFLLLNRCSR